MVSCVVGAVVAVTVMRVPLFVFDASMLREYESEMMTAMLVWGRRMYGCAMCGFEYMGGTRGSGIVSSTPNVLEMSVVRGVRGVGGVCEMCMCMCWFGVECRLCHFKYPVIHRIIYKIFTQNCI